MILICMYAKESKIEYNTQKLEQSLKIALGTDYLGFICRSVVGSYLSWLYQNQESWCIEHVSDLFPKENELFFSTILGLINYRKATTMIYPYLEPQLKRLLYLDIPTVSIGRFGYYILFYYLNNKILLENSSITKLSIREVFSNQIIKNNIFWQIYHIFSSKVELTDDQIDKIKALLDYYTKNRLGTIEDKLNQYDTLYLDGRFNSNWFIKKYAIWSKYDSIYKKSALFWEKLISDFTIPLSNRYLIILNNLFQQHDILDFNMEDFEKLYNLISLLGQKSKNKDDYKGMIDMIIKKLSNETQRERLRELYHII